jgi:DNA excision repair protein ERCC-6-like 2
MFVSAPIQLTLKLTPTYSVLTSFDTARNDIEHLYDLSWTVVIVDEVHYVKNPDSKLTRALNRIACKQRIGLTGTAIQNSYGELWTILDWANPGQVGTFNEWNSVSGNEYSHNMSLHDIPQYVILPLSIGQSSAASEDQRAQARVSNLAPCFSPELNIRFRKYL